MDYDVLEARYVRDYVIWVRCRDGTSGEVVCATFHTVTWPNGADVAPEFLHDNAKPEAEPTP